MSRGRQGRLQLWSNCRETLLPLIPNVIQLSQAAFRQIMIPAVEVAGKSPFAKIEITGGVLAEQAIKLFR